MLLTLILIGTLVFFIWYGIIFFLVKIAKNNFKSNSGINNSPKIISALISFILTFLVVYFWLFSSRSYNYKNAFIEKEKDGFVITVLGKRELMVHDPISFLKRSTYEDSIKFEVRNSQGVMKGTEVLARATYFKFTKGDISIDQKSMKIDLFFINAYDKTLDALQWNGEYELKWR